MKVSSLIAAGAIFACTVMTAASSFAQSITPGPLPGQTMFDGKMGNWYAPTSAEAYALVQKHYPCNRPSGGPTQDKTRVLVYCFLQYSNQLQFAVSFSRGIVNDDKVVAINYDIDKESRESSDKTSPVKPHGMNVPFLVGPQPDDAKKIAQDITKKVCRTYTGIKQQQRETIIYCDHNATWQVSALQGDNKAGIVVDMQSGEVMTRK